MDRDDKKMDVEKLQIYEANATRETMSQDFGKYERRLLFITQLGYVPVAASMLLTTFSEPTQAFCSAFNSSQHIVGMHEFHSLKIDFGYDCLSSSSSSSSTQVNTFLSSLLMWGALAGSFLCGILSDKYGRKPVFTGCLGLISLMNLLICFSSSLAWYQISVVLLILGFASGGYMVTNFVILTEAFELAKSRLFVVSLNGWSIGMVATAAIAWFTGHWFPYHATISVIAIMMAILAKALTFESCRWLSASGKCERAKQTSINVLTVNESKVVFDKIQELEWYEILGFTRPVHSIQGRKWTALFTSSQFLKPTLVMFYCFLASSIVSFGFYFSLDVLPGNRYANLACMGFFKFVLGFTPFLLSSYLTKRMIVIFSITICFLSALALLPIQILDITYLRWMISVLSLMVAAGIDPTWKINHLYSAELFPTSVRSMGRGVCNVGGRLGSVIAPMIIYLRSYAAALPNSIFCGLLFIQLVVVIGFLPNDDDKESNEMDED